MAKERRFAEPNQDWRAIKFALLLLAGIIFFVSITRSTPTGPEQECWQNTSTGEERCHAVNQNEGE